MKKLILAALLAINSFAQITFLPPAPGGAVGGGGGSYTAGFGINSAALTGGTVQVDNSVVPGLATANAYSNTQDYTSATPRFKLEAKTVGANVASASTIAVTDPIFHITGTTTINTITAPAMYTTTGYGGCIQPIADGAWATSTSGNIMLAFTATTGQQYTLCWDQATTKWYPIGISSSGSAYSPFISYAGGCSGGGVAYPMWGTPPSGGVASAACFGGNTGNGIAMGFRFANSGSPAVWIPFTVPHGWTSQSLTLEAVYYSQYTGSETWTVETIFFSTGSADPWSGSFNAAQTVNTTTAGADSTHWGMSKFSLSNLTMTGATADAEGYIRITRTDNSATGARAITRIKVY